LATLILLNLLYLKLSEVILWEKNVHVGKYNYAIENIFYH